MGGALAKGSIGVLVVAALGVALRVALEVIAPGRGLLAQVWTPAGLLTVAGAGLAVLLAVGQIPLRYNYRNLVVRWRITLMTALAFTVVVALLTVMLAFVRGMTALTEGSGQPGNVR
jgi:uncharacterized integral membrane protein